MANIKEGSGSKRATSMQGRGAARRERLLDAAIKLLGEKPLESISLSDIAGCANIPVGSAYHFYPNLNAVYAGLIQRFFNALEGTLAEPYTLPHSANWQSIIESAIDRAAGLYQARPDYRQLILGGKAPTEIKLSDRLNDETVGQNVIAIIEQHFVLPAFPRRNEVFFVAVEIADLVFTLSQMRHGEITEQMCTEAKRAVISYLRSYLPEYLPHRSELADANVSVIPGNGVKTAP